MLIIVPLASFSKEDKPLAKRNGATKLTSSTSKNSFFSLSIKSLSLVRAALFTKTSKEKQSFLIPSTKELISSSLVKSALYILTVLLYLFLISLARFKTPTSSL